MGLYTKSGKKLRNFDDLKNDGTYIIAGKHGLDEPPAPPQRCFNFISNYS